MEQKSITSMLHENKLRIAVTMSAMLWFIAVAVLCIRHSVRSVTHNAADSIQHNATDKTEKDVHETDDATTVKDKNADYLKYSNKIDKKIKIVKNTKQDVDLSSARTKMDIMHKNDIKKKIEDNSDELPATAKSTATSATAAEPSVPSSIPTPPTSDGGDIRPPKTHSRASTTDSATGTTSSPGLAHSSTDAATTMKTTAATSNIDDPVISATADSSSTKAKVHENTSSKKLMEILSTM